MQLLYDSINKSLDKFKGPYDVHTTCVVLIENIYNKLTMYIWSFVQTEQSIFITQKRAEATRNLSVYSAALCTTCVIY